MLLLKQRKRIVIEIVFSKKANQRLKELALYIFKKFQDADIVDIYLDKLMHFIIDTLVNFPLAGRSCEEYGKGTRKLVYQGFSIIYRIGLEQIEILTIYKENLP